MFRGEEDDSDYFPKLYYLTAVPTSIQKEPVMRLKKASNVIKKSSNECREATVGIQYL